MYILIDIMYCSTHTCINIHTQIFVHFYYIISHIISDVITVNSFFSGSLSAIMAI